MGNARNVALRLAMAAALAAGLAQQAAAVEIRVPVEVKPSRPEPAQPKAGLKDLGGGFAAIDLCEAFNNDGITSEADRNDADLDEWKQSFAAEELPDAGKLEPKGVGAAFLFPAKDPGKKNNVACGGQKLPVAAKAKQLLILATATDANQESKLTLHYADGQPATADLKVTDWCQAPAFGEKAAVTCPSRVAIGVGGDNVRGKEKKETHIWAIAVALDPNRELAAITLPNNPKIHIFAMTLVK